MNAVDQYFLDKKFDEINDKLKELTNIIKDMKHSEQSAIDQMLNDMSEEVERRNGVEL